MDPLSVCQSRKTRKIHLRISISRISIIFIVKLSQDYKKAKKKLNLIYFFVQQQIYLIHVIMLFSSSYFVISIIEKFFQNSREKFNKKMVTRIYNINLSIWCHNIFHLPPFLLFFLLFDVMLRSIIWAYFSLFWSGGKSRFGTNFYKSPFANHI